MDILYVWSLGVDVDVRVAEEDADDLEVALGGGRVQRRVLGCNSTDILNFGRKTGLQTGPGSGRNLVLGHYKF